MDRLGDPKREGGDFMMERLSSIIVTIVRGLVKITISFRFRKK
jgi:hypothetical protein